jgi:hypothetical protein
VALEFGCGRGPDQDRTEAAVLLTRLVTPSRTQRSGVVCIYNYICPQNKKRWAGPILNRSLGVPSERRTSLQNEFQSASLKAGPPWDASCTRGFINKYVCDYSGFELSWLGKAVSEDGALKSEGLFFDPTKLDKNRSQLQPSHLQGSGGEGEERRGRGCKGERRGGEKMMGNGKGREGMGLEDGSSGPLARDIIPERANE